jgi:hypothetical protein
MPIMSSSYALPPVKRAVRRMALTFGAIVVSIGGILAFFYIKGRITPQHVVIVENGNKFAVDVEIAGEKLTLAAGQHAAIRAHDGALTASAKGPNGFSDSASMELPGTGWVTAGRTAIYNVGGASDLAVVTVNYGMPVGAKDTPITLIDRADKLVLLPKNTNGSIDEAFPAEVKTKRSGEVLVHVCHADIAAKQLGCANI